MRRLPSEAALINSLEYSTEVLAHVKACAADLLRRRRFEAGRDGYPTASMGGGGSSGGTSSTTEVAALAPPMADPVGRYIDTVLEIVAEVDKRLQQANSCLANVVAVDQELRGRVSTVVECDACDAPVSGVGDDRRRNGFCPACYKSLLRWKTTAVDPSARNVFIVWRRAKLAEPRSA